MRKRGYTLEQARALCRVVGARVQVEHVITQNKDERWKENV